jgi:hypothetical protein
VRQSECKLAENGLHAAGVRIVARTPDEDGVRSLEPVLDVSFQNIPDEPERPTAQACQTLPFLNQHSRSASASRFFLNASRVSPDVRYQNLRQQWSAAYRTIKALYQTDLTAGDGPMVAN